MMAWSRGEEWRGRAVSVSSGRVQQARMESDARWLAFRRSGALQRKRVHCCGGDSGSWSG